MTTAYRRRRPDPIRELERRIFHRPELDTSWMNYAACREIRDPDLFYPARGACSGRAREVCSSCSVRIECLEYALDNKEQHGIWGGLARTERLRIGQERRRRAS